MLQIVACGVVLLLLLVCAFCFVMRMARKVPLCSVWRLPRTSVVALAALAVCATIFAQKRGGENERRDWQDSRNSGGEVVDGPSREDGNGGGPLTELCFTAIDVGTNGLVALDIAWPTNFFEAGTILDLFGKHPALTNNWEWQDAVVLAAGQTNHAFTIDMGELPDVETPPPAMFYKVVVIC